MLLNKRFDIDTVICPSAVVLAYYYIYVTIIYLKDLSLKE